MVFVFLFIYALLFFSPSSQQVLKASVRSGIRLQSSSAAAASAAALHSGSSAPLGYSFGEKDVAPLHHFE